MQNKNIMAKKQAKETYDEHIKRKQEEIVNRRLRMGEERGLPTRPGQAPDRSGQAFDPTKRLGEMTIRELEQRYGNTNPQNSNPHAMNPNTGKLGEHSGLVDVVLQQPRQIQAYDQPPLGYGGVLSQKRPPAYSPVANNLSDPSRAALVGSKATPFKLGRDSQANNARYYTKQSKDFDYQYDVRAQQQAEWGSTNPKLLPKSDYDYIQDLRQYEQHGASRTSLHQNEILNSGSESAIERQNYEAWRHNFRHQLTGKQSYIQAAHLMQSRKQGVHPHQEQIDQLGYVPHQAAGDATIDGMDGALPIPPQRTPGGVDFNTGEPDPDGSLAYASPSLDHEQYHKALIRK